MILQRLAVGDDLFVNFGIIRVLLVEAKDIFKLFPMRHYDRSKLINKLVSSAQDLMKGLW